MTSASESSVAFYLQVASKICEVFNRYVEHLQELFYYPLAIIFAVALQSVGSKILMILRSVSAERREPHHLFILLFAAKNSHDHSYANHGRTG